MRQEVKSMQLGPFHIIYTLCDINDYFYGMRYSA